MAARSSLDDGLLLLATLFGGFMLLFLLVRRGVRAGVRLGGDGSVEGGGGGGGG